MALITLQRPGQCDDCGAELPAGAQARYYGRGKLYGIGCHEPPAKESVPNDRIVSNGRQKEPRVSKAEAAISAKLRNAKPGEEVRLSCAETAVLVRAALATAFPGIDFAVRSKTYSMGASISVHWTDGPRQRDVEAVASAYEGKGFDGMVDLSYYRSHYLRPDGQTFVHYDSGTTGSMGVVPEEDNRALKQAMPSDVRVVHFGADSVHCSRTVSRYDEWTREAVEWVYRHCGVTGGTGNPNIDRFGNEPVDHLVRRMVHARLEGEDLKDTYDYVKYPG